MDHLSEAKEFARQGHHYVIGARPGTYLLEEAQRQGCGLALPLKSNFDIVSFLSDPNLHQKGKDRDPRHD
jgi:hypothetical protein